MSSESIRTNDHSKTRVNLGIDSQILKRAKAAGINISENTEDWLGFLTYESNTVEDIAKAYESFFQAIQPILKKYNSVVKVGKFFGTFYSIMQRLPKENFDSSDYLLILDRDALFISKDDRLYSLDIDLPSYLTERVVYLDEPKLILNNLLLALKEAAEANRDKIVELSLAKKLVDALFDDNTNSIAMNNSRNGDSPDRRIESMGSGETRNT